MFSAVLWNTTISHTLQLTKEFFVHYAKKWAVFLQKLILSPHLRSYDLDEVNGDLLLPEEGSAKHISIIRHWLLSGVQFTTLKSNLSTPVTRQNIMRSFML